eukprot:TRINITY_DN656_c0_g1_i1.p1 TRINITY_DN656_c0_g1~~TRINITY_DN656_c0_g1_i1.p1  ORF type:complete len:676 (-),score=148.08 TRINITY_DN656_c0_g1_i1:54-2081(-)
MRSRSSSTSFSRRILNDMDETAERDLVKKKGDFSFDEFMKKMDEHLIMLFHYFVDVDGKDLNYDDVKDSVVFKDVVELVQWLKIGNLNDLEVEKRKPFFMNLVSIAMVHCNIICGIPITWSDRTCLYSNWGYLIGENYFSISDMENGIIRGNIEGHMKLNDPRLEYSIDSDPRTHFAYVCSSKSYPPVRVFKRKDIEVSLEMCARVFVQMNIELDPLKKSIDLPTIFEVYKKDFGDSDTNILDFISNYLGIEQQKILKTIREKKYKVHFHNANWKIGSVPCPPKKGKRKKKRTTDIIDRRKLRKRSGPATLPVILSVKDEDPLEEETELNFTLTKSNVDVYSTVSYGKRKSEKRKSLATKRSKVEVESTIYDEQTDNSLFERKTNAESSPTISKGKRKSEKRKSSVPKRSKVDVEFTLPDDEHDSLFERKSNVDNYYTVSKGKRKSEKRRSLAPKRSKVDVEFTLPGEENTDNSLFERKSNVEAYHTISKGKRKSEKRKSSVSKRLKSPLSERVKGTSIDKTIHKSLLLSNESSDADTPKHVMFEGIKEKKRRRMSDFTLERKHQLLKKKNRMSEIPLGPLDKKKKRKSESRFKKVKGSMETIQSTDPNFITLKVKVFDATFDIIFPRDGKLDEYLNLIEKYCHIKVSKLKLRNIEVRDHHLSLLRENDTVKAIM